MNAGKALYKYLYKNGLIRCSWESLSKLQCNVIEAISATCHFPENEILNYLAHNLEMPFLSKIDQNFTETEDLKTLNRKISNRTAKIVLDLKQNPCLLVNNPFDLDLINSVRFVIGSDLKICLASKDTISVKPDTLEYKISDKKVLIVDDDEDLRNILEIQLIQESYTIEKAKDGLEGLKMLDVFNPDLVVLDLKMPVLNGEEFLSEVRANLKTSKLPVVVYTAIDSEDQEIKLIELGASDFVSKSASREVLNSRIRTALN